MAKTSKKSSETKVTRITASESGAKPVTSKPSVTRKLTDRLPKRVKPVETDEDTPKKRNFLQRISDYFRGAWYELQQVRWPDRRTTWAMTGALILFTAGFILLIVLIDFGFAELFKLIMGK